MLSPTPSELPRLKSVSAPTKPVSHTQQPQSGLGAQWDKIPTQQPNPTLFRPVSPTEPEKTALLWRSAPTSIGKQTFPQALRSHFRAKPALSRENRPHFCGETAFPARNRPPTFVGEPALFRVDQPHPGGAAGNLRVTAPGGKSSSQIENSSHAPDEPRPAQTSNPHFCGNVTILSDDQPHFHRKITDFAR